MPNILAFDTATNACSAALWSAGGVIASRHEDMGRGHAERLMPMVGEVMADVGMDSAALDLIAVTVGPGAFTGLRVGLAAARGLALARNIPCFGATTTRTIQAALDCHDPALVVLESKRADFFLQVFAADGTALSDPAAVLPEGLAAFVETLGIGPGPITVAGDGAPRAAPYLTEAGWDIHDSAIRYPNAIDLAALAAATWKPGRDLPPPAPLYLRPPDAVVPLNGGRLRP